VGRVLIVAGSDSGGGAGIQADLKAVTMLGGYAATAITALTAQNTLGVLGIEPVTPEFVELQMEAVLLDIGADAIKIGMLGSAANVVRVAATCRRLAPSVPIVLDPVMVAKGGARLLEPAAERALVGELVPMAALLTPNVPEAEALTGERVTDEAKLLYVASRLLLLGPGAVLLKGGHLEGDNVVDYLVTADGTVDRFESPRLRSRSTHGTGCTLASAIAAGIAEGLTLADSVARARRYVLEAIRTAPGLGSGHGPLNHGHPLAQSVPLPKSGTRAN
jgi:hydroxymethylpyrimidine/phosphomethylpyrimidine kinase